MANSFEMDGRGPSNQQLMILSVVVIIIAALFTMAMLVKSTGRLDANVPVVAEMTSVGDGLPQNSDVKYHGVLVGLVRDVIPAQHGQPNIVHIALKPDHAAEIPATVTARVVPSNIFAVSSVQLIANDADKGGPAIKAGTRIQEDTELPSVIFQTTLNKLRDILAATARNPREDNSIGIMAALNEATESRRNELLAAGAHLDRLVDELDKLAAPDATTPSTVSALLAAAGGLQQSAPELVEAFYGAVDPMKTLSEQRSQLTTMINGGMHTMGTTQTAFDNQTDRLISITHDLTPALGSIAMTSHNWLPGFKKINDLHDRFFKEVWMPDRDLTNLRVNLALAPSYSYTRADCPRYGELKGPSCYTAPLIAVRPDIPETLLPQNYQPPKDLAPPRGTILGPNGNLVAVGPPLINPYPNLTDPNPPLPDGMTPAPPVPGSANPDLGSPRIPPTPVMSPPAPVARPGYPDFPWPGPGSGAPGAAPDPPHPSRTTRPLPPSGTGPGRTSPIPPSNARTHPGRRTAPGSAPPTPAAG